MKKRKALILNIQDPNPPPSQFFGQVKTNRKIFQKKHIISNSLISNISNININ